MTSGPMGQVPPAFNGPPTSAAPGGWKAPDAGGPGQLTVDRSVLRNIASQMNADLRELDLAMSRLQSIGRGAGAISGWSTANAFSGNADNAYSGVVQAGTQAGDTHSSTSRKLTDNASNYDTAEEHSTRQISNVRQMLESESGSVAAAGRG